MCCVVAAGLLPPLGRLRRAAPRRRRPVAPAPVEVQILAINDFHGNLEPPPRRSPSPGRRQQGHAAPAARRHLAARAARSSAPPHSVTVAAGDLIGASPAGLGLVPRRADDRGAEPAGLELAAVGNHEFDKGSAELKRMQDGGCDKHTTRQPCRSSRSRARASTISPPMSSAPTARPCSRHRDRASFGPVKIGFIGMTLKEPRRWSRPPGVAGLTFTDEAATANALVPGAEGRRRRHRSCC